MHTRSGVRPAPSPASFPLCLLALSRWQSGEGVTLKPLLETTQRAGAGKENQSLFFLLEQAVLRLRGGGILFRGTHLVLMAGCSS